MPERPRFRLIGDPHITRKFEVGVPLARKGEREASLFADLESRLWGEEEVLIIVGDLFEKPICNLVDLYKTMEMLRTAAASQPDKKIVVMAGNHDISPQADSPGAFHILTLMEQSNLFFPRWPEIFNGIAVFPWEWERSAVEQLTDLEGEKFDVAVGHWDLVSYDGMHDAHLCPAKQLINMGATEIYSGHWHIAGDYVVDGVTVRCTGSMQPMTHAEDPDGKLYVTLTLDEYEDTDPLTLKDKYVRVVAKPGEEVLQVPDCLGFKIKRTAIDGWEEDYGEVKVEGFKVSDIIDKAIKKHDVPAEVSTFIKERIDASD